MSNEELQKAIENLENGLMGMSDGEYIPIRKNVLKSTLENYKELLMLRSDKNA